MDRSNFIVLHNLLVLDILPNIQINPEIAEKIFDTEELYEIDLYKNVHWTKWDKVHERIADRIIDALVDAFDSG